MNQTDKIFNHIMVLFIIGTLIAGCAAAISKQALSQVTVSKPFDIINKNPDKYVGEVVLLGGKLIEAKANIKNSELIVLQVDLDHRNRPTDLGNSKGRYIIRSDEFLDPAIYQNGKYLTMVGKLSHVEIRKIGEIDYSYLIFDSIELKLWDDEALRSPRVHIGIGFGTSF